MPTRSMRRIDGRAVPRLVDVIDCSDPHDAEVVATGRLNPGRDRAYPSDDELFAEIAANNPEDTTIQYALDKQLAGQWSLVLGGQFQFNPHWMLRWEYSHSETRAAFLLNLNYRFGL